jgi:hypothetical protein
VDDSLPLNIFVLCLLHFQHRPVLVNPPTEHDYLFPFGSSLIRLNSSNPCRVRNLPSKLRDSFQRFPLLISLRPKIDSEQLNDVRS